MMNHINYISDLPFHIIERILGDSDVAEFPVYGKAIPAFAIVMNQSVSLWVEHAKAFSDRWRTLLLPPSKPVSSRVLRDLQKAVYRAAKIEKTWSSSNPIAFNRIDLDLDVDTERNIQVLYLGSDHALLYTAEGFLRLLDITTMKIVGVLYIDENLIVRYCKAIYTVCSVEVYCAIEDEAENIDGASAIKQNPTKLILIKAYFPLHDAASCQNSRCGFISISHKQTAEKVTEVTFQGKVADLAIVDIDRRSLVVIEEIRDSKGVRYQIVSIRDWNKKHRHILKLTTKSVYDPSWAVYLVTSPMKSEDVQYCARYPNSIVRSSVPIYGHRFPGSVIRSSMSFYTPLHKRRNSSKSALAKIKAEIYQDNESVQITPAGKVFKWSSMAAEHSPFKFFDNKPLVLKVYQHFFIHPFSSLNSPQILLSTTIIYQITNPITNNKAKPFLAFKRKSWALIQHYSTLEGAYTSRCLINISNPITHFETLSDEPKPVIATSFRHAIWAEVADGEPKNRSGDIQLKLATFPDPSFVGADDSNLEVGTRDLEAHIATLDVPSEILRMSTSYIIDERRGIILIDACKKMHMFRYA